MVYIKIKRWMCLVSSFIYLAILAGCNRDNVDPMMANDASGMGQVDMITDAPVADQGLVCTGKPEFILFAGVYEFVPQSATLCPIQRLQMCGANVACIGTTILIGGEVAPIVEYPSTSEPCVIVSMPQQLRPMLPDAGETFVGVQASNQFGSVVASHQLKLLNASCP